MQPSTGQPTTVNWDANGNLLVENTGGQLTTCTWESENRLTRVSYSDGTLDTFLYSAEGLRQRKQTLGGMVNFAWDGQNALQEKGANQATQAQYTDFPGFWGGLVSQRRSNASGFYGFDQQSNSRILTS